MYVAMTNRCLLLDKITNRCWLLDKIWFPYQITWFAKPLSHDVLDIKPAIYNDAQWGIKMLHRKFYIYTNGWFQWRRVESFKQHFIGLSNPFSYMHLTSFAYEINFLQTVGKICLTHYHLEIRYMSARLFYLTHISKQGAADTMIS